MIGKIFAKKNVAQNYSITIGTPCIIRYTTPRAYIIAHNMVYNVVYSWKINFSIIATICFIQQWTKKKKEKKKHAHVRTAEQSVREISPLIGRLLNVEPVRGPVRKYVSTYRRLQLVGKLNFHRPIVSANRSLVLISVDVSGPPSLPPPIVASPDYYPCTGYATRRRSAGRYLIKYIEEQRRFLKPADRP